MNKHTLVFTAIAAAGVTLPNAFANDAFKTSHAELAITVAQTTTGGADKPETAKRSAGDVSEVDRKFAQKAVDGGAKEVALGQLAQEKSSNDQVKKFGKQMVNDHSKANKELLNLDATKKVASQGPPFKEMDPKSGQDMKQLSNLSGAKFDRQYMQTMVMDHEETVRNFEEYAKNGKNAELRAFAEKSLPTLREHLKMAREVSQQIGKAGDTPSRKQ